MTCDKRGFPREQGLPVKDATQAWGAPPPLLPGSMAPLYISKLTHPVFPGHPAPLSAPGCQDPTSG